MTTGYVVNQTHWDREWYFTNADALILSDEVFSDVLDELEQHPEANFCLDAQSSILDEYLELYPENESRVKELIAKQQLFIGPWFTQSDCLLVDGESLIRNAIIGVRDCKRYGEAMPIGYIPDTFGFNAQMPTLLQQIGLDNLIFWRGIDFSKQVSTPYFKWKGLGEKEVYAMNIPQGYGCTPNMQTTQEYIDNRMDGYIDFVNQFQEHEDILVPAGGDQQAIVRQLHSKLKEINEKSKHTYKISTFPEFLKKVKEQKNLPVYQGEFRLPAYARIHRTISSVRMDIKLANYQLEQKLLKRIEPLYVLAQKYEIQLSQELLIKVWKKVLASQAHDSLGGCVYDNVAADILHRYKEAEEMADGIENVITKKLARKLRLTENQVLVINTAARTRNKYFKIKVISQSKNIRFPQAEDAWIAHEKKYTAREDILIEKPEGKFYLTEPEYLELDVMVKLSVPGLGFKVLNFEESSKPMAEYQSIKSGDDVAIKNDFIELRFASGHLSATFQGEKITDFIRLVDCANDGDTYDFSPLRGDYEVDLPFDYAEKKATSHSQKLIISGQTALPFDLADRQNPKGDHRVVKYQVTLKMNDDNSVIEGSVEIDNQVLSHRVRLVFDPKIKQGDTYEGVTAGHLKNNHVDEVNIDNYPEYPAPLNIFDKTLSLANQVRAFDFYGHGLKEYEHSEDKIFITLFASTGQFGKSDLLWRTGRASGDTTNQGHVMHETPLAQFSGLRSFDFAFSLHQGSFDEKQVEETLSIISEQTISYQAQTLNHFIYRLDNKIQEREESLLELQEDGLLELDGLTVSAIYPSFFEKDKKYIVRLSNATGSDVRIRKEYFEGKHPVIVNALEEEIDQNFVVKPYDLLSVKLSY